MTACPPPPGRCTSSRTTSGSSRPISSMAGPTSSASPTTSTRVPSSARTPERNRPWSSTRTTRGGPPGRAAACAAPGCSSPRPACRAGAVPQALTAPVRGIVSVTFVPSPGADCTVASPPCRLIRPRMDSATPLRSPGTAAGSKPLPRSRTATLTLSGSTSANTEITAAPDHLAAFTVASLAAASSALRCSSSGQSPTVTTSTGTPCLASTSRWIWRTPSASDEASASPGARPSNSQERSSRSCARASWTTACGSSARRWMSASVCSTESCTRAAMSARSSARARACRSITRSRAIRSHQGPSSSTSAAATSRKPPSGASSWVPPCRLSSQPSPTASSTAAPAIRSLVAAAGRGPAWSEVSSGCTRRLHACPLAVRRVAPDERQARDADHLRPAVGLDRAVVQRAGQEKEHGEQRGEGEGERDAARVVLRPARDARLLPLGRDQQPAEDVERDRPARADQRGDGEHDPHGGRAEAAPRRDAGGHAARERSSGWRRSGSPSPRSRHFPTRRPVHRRACRRLCPGSPCQGGPCRRRPVPCRTAVLVTSCIPPSSPVIPRRGHRGFP